MLELIVAASLIGALVIGTSRRRPATEYGAVGRVQIMDNDLPCPWCRAQTAEEDHTCPSCGRAFG